MTICPKPQLQGGSWREGGLQPFQPFSPPIGPSALTFRLVIPAEGSKGATRSGGLGGRLGPTPLQVVQAGPELPPDSRCNKRGVWPRGGGLARRPGEARQTAGGGCGPSWAKDTPHNVLQGTAASPASSPSTPTTPQFLRLAATLRRH